MKGGYQIVDFKGVAITLDEEITIDGIYEAVTNGNKKALLLENLNVGGTLFQAIYVVAPVSVDSTTGIATIVAYEYTIEVANDDGVTVSSISDSDDET